MPPERPTKFETRILDVFPILFVIPAKAGVQGCRSAAFAPWTPAFAGETSNIDALPGQSHLRGSASTRGRVRDSG
jgi:hypothetical protein